MLGRSRRRIRSIRESIGSAAYACEPLESRRLLSTIIWTNRGINSGPNSDNFNDVFGVQEAGVVRPIVDAAITSWQRVINNFNFPGGGNTYNISIQFAANGTSTGASGSINTTTSDGKPISGSLTIGRGNDTNGDGKGDGAGYFLDSTPLDNSEFQAAPTNAYAGYAAPGSPAAGLGDLYQIVLHEMGHALGLLPTTRIQALSTDTSVGDSIDSNPAVANYWRFDGPNVKTLMTGYDSNAPNNRNGSQHRAPAGAQVTVNGTTYFGADDLMNPFYALGQRHLISNVDSIMLFDAYGFDITPGGFFGTYYDQLDADGTLRFDLPAGNNTLTITPNQTGTISVSLQLGQPVQGADPPIINSLFNSAQVQRIVVNGGSGNDIIRLEGNTGKPTTVNGGGGDDVLDLCFNSRNLSNITGAVTFNGDGGTNSIFVYDNANTNAGTYVVTDAGIGRVGFGGLTYRDSAFVRLWTGTGADVVAVPTTRAGTKLFLNSAGGADAVNIYGGSSSGVTGILGDIEIQNDPDFSTVSIDDSGDRAGRIGNIDVSDQFGWLQGLAPATIFWYKSGVKEVHVTTGRGNDTLNVLRSNRRLYLTSEGGQDNVTIGNNATGVSEIAAPVDAGPNAGGFFLYNASLTINDAASAVGRAWNISPTQVSTPGLTVNSIDIASLTLLAGTGNDTLITTPGSYRQAMTIDAGGGSDDVQLFGTLITSITVRGGADSVSDSLLVDDRNIPTNMSGGAVYADRISRIVDEPTPSDVYYSGFSSVAWYQQDSQNSISVLGVPSDIGANNSFYILGSAFDDIVDVYPRDAAGNPTILGNLYFDGGAGPNWLQVFASGSNPVGYRVFQQFGLNDVFISTISAGAAWIGARTNVQNVAIHGGTGNDFFRVDQYKAGSALSIYGGGGFDTCTIGGGNLAANITNIAAFTFDGQNGNANFVVDNSATTDAWNYRINDPSLIASQSGGYFVTLTAKNIKTQKLMAGSAGDIFDVDAIEAGVDTELRGVGGLKQMRMGSTSGTVGTIRGKVSFLPGPGGGYMQIGNNADSTADTVHLTATTLGAFAGDNLFGPGGSLVFENIVNGPGLDPGIHLLLSSGANTVYAQPLASARVTINSHPIFVSPSGSIKLALAGVTNPIINGDAVAGSLTSSNRQTLSWSRFAGTIDTDAVAPAMVGANINPDGNPPAPGPGTAKGPSAAAVGHQLSLDVQFSEDVSGLISTTWLELTHLPSNTSIARSNIAVAYDKATNTAHFTFPGYPNGVLPDGNYHGRILAGLPDFFGNALASDAQFDFFVLNGDLNHDRTVSIADFITLASNFGKTNASYSEGDLNYDGQVSIADFIDLAANFNKTLAAPAPAPQPPAAQSLSIASDDTKNVLDSPTAAKRRPQRRMHHRRPRSTGIWMV